MVLGESWELGRLEAVVLEERPMWAGLKTMLSTVPSSPSGLDEVGCTVWEASCL